MLFRFKSKKLQKLYEEEKDSHKWGEAIVESFFELMAVIAHANDERDFSQLRGLNFEKLSGRRKGQYSMRLNDQFRLVMTLEHTEKGKQVSILEITDYHD